MKRNSSALLVQFVLISLLIVLAVAETNYRNQRKNDEPQEQGRTLGLIRPLLGLGLNAITRPLVGYDVPYIPGTSNRPNSATGSSQSESDPYFGYGSYGGYNPNFYNGYSYYAGYPIYRPAYPFYNAYRPPFYPGYYGGYAQNAGFGVTRPTYSNSRPIAQRPVYSNSKPRPIAGQQPAAYPTVSPAPSSTSGTTSLTANSAQAVQIANLLGQLLGQQLRPLLNPGAASPAHDSPGIAHSSYQDKSFRNRYSRG